MYHSFLVSSKVSRGSDKFLRNLAMFSRVYLCFLEFSQAFQNLIRFPGCGHFFGNSAKSSGNLAKFSGLLDRKSDIEHRRSRLQHRRNGLQYRRSGHRSNRSDLVKMEL